MERIKSRCTVTKQRDSTNKDQLSGEPAESRSVNFGWCVAFIDATLEHR
jgi:hypothetical protein